MAQIQKGTTYSTGDQVTATNLNALADAAILLPGAITDQTAKTVPLAADTVLIHSAADTALRKSTLTQLFSNATGIPISTGISGLGTGIATALAVNTGSAGAPVLFNGALGTPASGTVTNLTGTASININGTVGATTRNTVAATTGNFQASGGAPIILTGNASAQIQLGGTGATDPSIRYDAAGVLGVVTADQSAYAKIKALDFQGTVGATTASTGAFTTLSASGTANIGGGTAYGTGATIKPATDDYGLTLLQSNTNSAGWGLKADTSGNLLFARYGASVFGTPAISIALGGAVSMANGLAVTGALSATGVVSLTGTSPTLRIGNQASGGAGAILQLAPSSTQTNWLLGANQNVSGAFEITPSTAGGGTTFSTPSFIINSSGNVGIGTSSPSAKLEASGASAAGLSIGGRFTNTTASGFTTVEFSNGSATMGQIWAGNGSYASFGGASSLNYSANSGPHVWYTNYVERARIDSSGNLLVGTTSGSGNRVDIVGSNGCKISGWGAGVGTGLTMETTTTTSSDSISFTVNGTQIGKIQTTSSGTSYVTSSDYRRKSNVKDLTGSGAFIDALKPRTFDWDTGDKGVGFIAHEFAEVSPSSVSGEKDAVDNDGKPVYQGMQASSAEVIANLVAELKSLRQRVAALESN